MRTTIKIMGILVWALGVVGCGNADTGTPGNAPGTAANSSETQSLRRSPDACLEQRATCYGDASLACTQGIDEQACLGLMADCDAQFFKCSPPITCIDRYIDCNEEAKLGCLNTQVCQALVAQCQAMDAKCPGPDAPLGTDPVLLPYPPTPKAN